MIKKIALWFNCARAYSLPMTFMSWFAAFILGHKNGGDIFCGVLALFGIAFAHLACNMFDDYFDYHSMKNFAQPCKCRYIIDGLVSSRVFLTGALVFLALAALVGAILFFFSGVSVIYLAIVGLFIALFYSKFSMIGLSELFVGIAFGPLLFEGVYYVMCKSFSIDAFLISIPCVMFVISLLYVHTLLDYDGDVKSHKKTLCSRFSKPDALKFLLFFIISGYVGVAIFALKTGVYALFLPYVTVPLAFELYKSLKLYNEDKSVLPTSHFWNFPMEKCAQDQTNDSAGFYFRFFLSRNLVTNFMLCLCLAMMLFL